MAKMRVKNFKVVEEVKNLKEKKEVNPLKLRDVENFMGKPKAEFVSKTSVEMGDPAYRSFDCLVEVGVCALFRDYPQENHVNKFDDYYSNKRITNTTPTQQVQPETERLQLQEEKRDNNVIRSSIVQRQLSFDDDVSDEDYEEEEEEENYRAKKKIKTTSSSSGSGGGSDSGSGSGGNKKRRGLGSVYDGPNPPPPLPQEVRRVIRESGADEEEEPVLVIQKVLKASDIKKNQNRLSIPSSKVRERFLMDGEEETLRERRVDKYGKDKGVEYIDVGFIQPKLTRREGIKLRRWVMKKSNGAGSVSYMLTGTWNHVVEDEGYRDYNPKVVQLWAYRLNRELSFALVNLPNPNPNPNPNPSANGMVA